MRNYRGNITLEQANKIVGYCADKGYTIDEFQGNLLDNYIIYNTNDISINKRKPRQFIIIKEAYQGEWSSSLEIIQTDNEKLAEKYKDVFAS